MTLGVFGIRLHDCTQAANLLSVSMVTPREYRIKARNVHMAEVSADKAHLSRADLALVDSLEGVPFVPLKRNQDGRESPPSGGRGRDAASSFPQGDSVRHHS
ncbi:MAG: hypothetical protein ACRDGF_03225 [Chloroflexota bacterium]